MKGTVKISENRKEKAVDFDFHSVLMNPGIEKINEEKLRFGQ